MNAGVDRKGGVPLTGASNSYNMTLTEAEHGKPLVYICHEICSSLVVK